MISTKGRYAIRVMIDLAENDNGKYIPMKDVAKRQGLSLKYMERILPALTKSRIVEGMHGKGGGYRLTRSPEEYTIGEILRRTETHFAPVACLEDDAPACSRADDCPTLEMWKGYYKLINDYFDGIRLSDLIHKDLSDNYVI